MNVVGNDFDESIVTHLRLNRIFHLYPKPDGGFDYRLTPLPKRGLFQGVARPTAPWRSTCSAMLASPMCDRWGLLNLALADRPMPLHARTDRPRTPIRCASRRATGSSMFLGALPQAARPPASDIILVVDAPLSRGPCCSVARVQPSYFVLMRNRIIAEGKACGSR